jgi:Trk K+ transport system NAD-binding subunit
MTSKNQKVLIIGLGVFEKELLKRISDTWETVVLDIDSKRIKTCSQEVPRAQFITGDASSVLTWKKFKVEGLRHVISTVRDVDVNLEICRYIRMTYGPDISIIILIYGTIDLKLFEKYRATIINPMELGIHAVIKIMEKNYVHATNIGLGMGELVEVNILARSHLVDRKLKQLRPANWQVSAVYRNEHLIIPDDNTTLKVGDKVVLVGNPKILENVANVLTKGIPQFPLQFGTDLVFPFHQHFLSHLEELADWYSNYKAKKILFIPVQHHFPKTEIKKINPKIRQFETGERVEIFQDIFKLEINTAILFMPIGKNRLDRLHIRAAFKHSEKPFLIARLSFPYQRIVISLNGPDPELALETGMEISQMLGCPFEVILVVLPRELRGFAEEKQIEHCKGLIKDFEDIYKIRISFKKLEGNPITQTRKHLTELKQQLFIITSNPSVSFSFFKPNISYMIALKNSLSTLVIPTSNE